MPSNIQVFVTWKDQTIFAGEDVECTITFRNVTEGPDSNHRRDEGQFQRKLSRVANHTNSDSVFSFKSSQSLFSSHRSYSISSQKKLHRRTASSLSSPLISAHSFPPASGPPTPQSWRPGHSHKRSVSILSIDSEGWQLEKTAPPPSFQRQRLARGHTRSASLQVAPRRTDGHDELYRIVSKGPMREVPLAESPNKSSSGPSKVDSTHIGPASRPGSLATSPIAPNNPMHHPTRKSQSAAPFDFKFPVARPSIDSNNIRPAHPPSPTPAERNTANGRTIPKDGPTLSAPSHQQLARVISATSANGSSRSSGEFYSISDNSSETLTSEYTNCSAQGTRAHPPARHGRHHSTVVTSKADGSQALLMGYAQVSASFTVDSSLVNQSVFDDVKRKGVVGGQAGTNAALPGRPTSASSDRPRKGGGFWGALKWNAIEESINGLLSNNELDGLREMRGVTSSRSIPLLSTPQSLLFVDLRLAPGEEQSYRFSFALPRGLPASHKGKAIKISYNLVIGTQRPSGPNEPQRVNRINIPFRVYSGVNDKGDVLGHDLMSPYVLLRDQAKVQKVGPNTSIALKNHRMSGSSSSASEFLSYVDELVEERARSNSLYPPGALPERRGSYEGPPHPLTCKDIIDLAILRSNQAVQSRRSPNRFEIARDGRRIAVIVLNRPVHRLGETIIATVDFGDASVPCYAVRASLETSEKVVPTLAVRSNASIHRSTRRIHASLYENTLYATRVAFSPSIPIVATPTIVTSGVTLDWDLRFEFVTPNPSDDRVHGPSGTRLLEIMSSDDRGKVLSAMEYLGCESFEISIPLTVYGETVRERLPEENEGYAI